MALKRVVFLFLLGSLFLMPTLVPFSNAADSTLRPCVPYYVCVTPSHVSENQRILVYGTIPFNAANVKVSVTVYNPRNVLIASRHTLSDSTGQFFVHFMTGGPGYGLSGTYIIVAAYGDGVTTTGSFSYVS